MNKICSACKIDKDSSDFNKSSIALSGFRPECRECQHGRERTYRAKNKDRHSKYWKDYYLTNKQDISLRVAQKNQALRNQVLDTYGAWCHCCGETEKDFLTIDHIDGGGRRHKKKVGSGIRFYRWLISNNFPVGFEILCYNCNCAKGKLGYCPHKIQVEVNV